MKAEYVAVAANARMGGAITVVAGLLAAGRRADEPLHLIASPELVDQVGDLSAGVTILGASNPAVRLIEARRALRAFRPRAALLFDNLPLRSGLPEVVIVHNAYLARPGQWRRDVRATWLRVAARSAHTLVTPTRVLATEVQRFTGHPRCVAIPHGVDLLVRDWAAPGRADGTRRMLHVGLPSPQKNMFVLLDVLARLPGNVRLLWTVDPTHRDGRALQERARTVGVADRIDWLGILDRPGLVSAFASADVFVFPSDVESFGLPVAEALRSGLPVTVADRPWAREICGDAALYADPRLAGDFAATVSRVVGDQALAKRLSAAGKQQAERYDWDIAFAHYLELLHAASVDR